VKINSKLKLLILNLLERWYFGSSKNIIWKI